MFDSYRPTRRKKLGETKNVISNYEFLSRTLFLVRISISSINVYFRFRFRFWADSLIIHSWAWPITHAIILRRGHTHLARSTRLRINTTAITIAVGLDILISWVFFLGKWHTHKKKQIPTSTPLCHGIVSNSLAIFELTFNKNDY